MLIDVLTVNYNTPDLIEPLFLSIAKHLTYDVNYNIINNGPQIYNKNADVFNLIDRVEENKKFIEELKKSNKLILRKSNSVFGSASHAKIIDEFIYQISNADYILLFDTDVIINENFDDKIKFLIESNQPFYSCETPEDISGNKFLRVGPHCCFINKYCFIKLNLHFFTPEKFLDISYPHSYDTGRSLYEYTKYLNLKYFKDNSFFKHFKGISWKRC